MVGKHKVEEQVTKWVGGTIMVLMLLFVLIDLGLQTVQLGRYHEDVAAQGAEGLRQFFQGREVGDDPEGFFGGSDLLVYVQGRRAGFAVFDLSGDRIYATPLAFSKNWDETQALFTVPPYGEVEFSRGSIAGTSVVATAERFTTRDDPPWEGVVVYLVNVSDLRQTATFLWAWRALIILVIIIGVMLAVRIPVRKFIIKPLDTLFVGAYAAGRDDYRGLAPCPVENEFEDLYEMFNRLMTHLADTRIIEATLLDDEGEVPGGQPPPADED